MLTSPLRTADFDYALPDELVAQAPAAQREGARMLVLVRASGRIEHAGVSDLVNFLRRGDVLVLNNSRVIPARLRARNERTGGRFEILLLEEKAKHDWWAMLKPGRRARPGSRLVLQDVQGNATEIVATVVSSNDEGHRRLQFSGTEDMFQLLEAFGEVPLPPYIRRSGTEVQAMDRERYQTVFAKAPGSVAAPTAGLHFSEALLQSLRTHGVEVCFVTLHVGLGTFAPVKSETLASHRMHEEHYSVDATTAELINSARSAGRRIVAVGTTTVRVLESLAERHAGKLVAGSGRTRIFIYPPYDFKTVDVLLTNFHLPRSTLLMLVSAFAAPRETHGRELLLAAYTEAVRERYRFYSYGDAMLLI
jgi:S-adenosylmethionine:tRNA ribosyltransferase-isomerase